jgi:hypothetical protein
MTLALILLFTITLSVKVQKEPRYARGNVRKHRLR